MKLMFRGLHDQLESDIKALSLLPALEEQAHKAISHFEEIQIGTAGAPEHSSMGAPLGTRTADGLKTPGLILFSGLVDKPPPQFAVLV